MIFKIKNWWFVGCWVGALLFGLAQLASPERVVISGEDAVPLRIERPNASPFPTTGAVTNATTSATWSVVPNAGTMCMISVDGGRNGISSPCGSVPVSR